MFSCSTLSCNVIWGVTIRWCWDNRRGSG